MILDKIINEKYEEVADLKAPRNSLKNKLSEPGISLIAEIKKASPSKGLIQENFCPEKQFKAYEKAGVSAISVLTDKKFFQGNNQILKMISLQTDLPVLRKEFIIDPIQVYQSFFLGADVVLLIVAVLETQELKELLSLVSELKMEAIVEVHNQKELEIALETQAEIIGINNRDLNTFQVDLQTTENLIKQLKSTNRRNDYFIIAESGIKIKSDIEYMRNINIDGVLIGETLMRADDPITKIKELGLFKGELK